MSAPVLYGEDLAHVQTSAYAGHVQASAQGLLAQLARRPLPAGEVLDLRVGGRR